MGGNWRVEEENGFIGELATSAVRFNNTSDVRANKIKQFRKRDTWWGHCWTYKQGPSCMKGLYFTYCYAIFIPVK